MANHKHIFIFHGQDDFTSLAKLKAWVKAFEQKHPNCSLVKIDADELTYDQVISKISDLLAGQTLFGANQLVVVKRLFSSLDFSASSSVNFLGRLASVLVNFPSQSFIVFWEPKEIIWPKRNPLLMIEGLSVEKFDIPQAGRMVTWLESEINKRRLVLTPRQKEEIKEAVGFYLSVRDQKANGYSYNLHEVSVLLDSLAGGLRAGGDFQELLDNITDRKDNLLVFDLIDALAEKDQKRSLKIYYQLSRKLSSEEIFSMIVWYYRLLLKLYSKANDRKAKISLSPYLEKKYQPAILNLSLASFSIFLARLLEADYKMKTGFDPVDMVERVVLESSS